MKPNSKSSIAYNYIAKAIYNREVAKDSMLEPETILAKKLNISRVTLRRAIDKLVLDGLIEKIPNKGYKVLGDYSIKQNGKKRNTLLFIHSYEQEKIERDAFHMQIWIGIQKCAHENNFIPLSLSLPTEDLIQKNTDFIKDNCLGIICDIAEPNKVSLLLSLNIPLVMVDSVGESKTTDMIIQDNFGGIKKAVQELAKRNTKKIGYLDSSLQLKLENRDLHASERELSFIQNTTLLNYTQRAIVIEKSTMDPPSVKKALQKLFKANIDGLILPFSEYIKDIEPNFWNHLPPQIKIVVWGEATITHPNIIYLSNLKWDPKTMGHESVLRLMQRIKKPDLNPMKILIPVNLIEGHAIPSTKREL